MSGDGTGGALDGAGGASADDGDTLVFVLFGQSNMWGVPAPTEEDRGVNPRVEVMALTSCTDQTQGEWFPAQPPLHGCIGKGSGNPGLGPGDVFAKTVAAARPEATILLVPNAIPGVSIDVFMPGEPAYVSTVERAKKGQQRGTIAGFIFHQGETDTGQESWLTRVNEVVSSLRNDLDAPDAPFIAGELPYDGCCGTGHNPVIKRLPENVTNSYVVSAEGLSIMEDGLHFDAQAQREFGKRYADVFLSLSID